MIIALKKTDKFGWAVLIRGVRTPCVQPSIAAGRITWTQFNYPEFESARVGPNVWDRV